jgi:hypothetical protein
MLIRFLQVATSLMHTSKGIETQRKDFLIPRLTGKLYGLLSTSFFQETVLVSRLLVMGTRQVEEAFPLLTLLPCCVCDLAHHLKIRNGIIIFTQVHPYKTTCFIYGKELRHIQQFPEARKSQPSSGIPT